MNKDIEKAKEEVLSYYKDVIDHKTEVHGIDLTTIISDCVTAGYNAAVKKQWISVEESTPDFAVPVLMKLMDSSCVIGYYLRHRERGNGFYTYLEPDIEFEVNYIYGLPVKCWKYVDL